jgi:hypothetical protein
MPRLRALNIAESGSGGAVSSAEGKFENELFSHGK